VRRAAKVDANHAEVVKALRDAGCGVLDLSAVGAGVPDLLVHSPTYPYRYTLMEIKDGAKPPSATQLTAAQMRFHAQWRGALTVVRNVEQALMAVWIP
jgi:hypothetical protein